MFTYSLIVKNSSVRSLNVKTFLFLIMQFSISPQFSSIRPIDRTLSGAITLGQSGPGSNSNKGVFCIPQSSSITWASSSDFLVLYLGHSLVESFPSAEMQLGWCILQPQPIGTYLKKIWPLPSSPHYSMRYYKEKLCCRTFQEVMGYVQSSQITKAQRSSDKFLIVHSKFKYMIIKFLEKKKKGFIFAII